MSGLAVISGGSKGIGKALVMRFAEAGFEVATCGRSQGSLQELEKEFSARFPKARLYAFQADLSKKDQVHAWLLSISQLEAPLEVLINNSGRYIPGQVHQEPEGQLEEMIETNVYSAYYVTRGLVPAMIKRQSGHIFTICSTASIMPYVNGGSYCISKFALLGFSQVLREELKPHKIRVTSILPGATLTSSWDGVELPPERFMPPEDVAETVFSAYQLSKRSVIETLVMRPQLGDL
ncbi:MAG: SDR family oxidoreductase [Cytophagaceae bacterium]|jgi:hypothetical protein|nr:SDR family oxidoreductase [Cytophagaceae bacterium]